MCDACMHATAGSFDVRVCVLSSISCVHVHLCIMHLQVELIRRDYVANGGWETFLSYEDPVQV